MRGASRPSIPSGRKRPLQAVVLDLAHVVRGLAALMPMEPARELEAFADAIAEELS